MDPSVTETTRVPTIYGYTFLEKVAVGGTSELWRAIDIATGSLVAVKVLLPQFTEDLEARRAFFDEAIVIAGLHHSGIVRGVVYGVCEDSWYSVLEYVDGYTVSSLLERKGRLAEADCLLIAESVACALDEAWRHGIVHCDVKPENLMISTEGAVKIIDFGSAHRVGSTDGAQCSARHVVGTPAYISPEQVAGDCELDFRSDIYSLGATLYHLATGQILFPEAADDEAFYVHCWDDAQALDPREIVPEISPAFAGLLEAMLVKDRNHRLESWSRVFSYCRYVEAGGAQVPRKSPTPSTLRLRNK